MITGGNSIKHLIKKFARRWESWAIGLYEADAELNLRPASRVKNPILTARDVTDIKADFIADPFMLHENGTWYLFFEVLNSADNLGYIAFATSSNGRDWSYQKVVLKEPFHLSYPYVFKWNDDYYMIPETYQAGQVRLYKADRFPDRWT
ncbi:MAG: hypothetical protein VKJ24_03975, partial [Synechococcales bacterium]|nr:hypothetical protein [Synechococcales bacterium]